MIDINSLLILVPLLLAVGAVAGVLAGLLGVGGGIVIVPILYWMVEIGMLPVPDEHGIHFAVATSLATIIPTSISSARAHHRKGSIDMDLFRAWAPLIAVGALLGGLLAIWVDSEGLTAVFGFVALAVVLNMLNPKPFTLAEHPPRSLAGRAAVAAPIGALSAMMGIGGGTLSVPTLTLMSFPVHRAVGTAALFGLVIAVPGVIGYAVAGAVPGLLPGSLGYINLPAAVVISIATFLCAPLGVTIAHRLNPRGLRLAFAIFLGISALKMLWETFS
ncbi:sulfite exporter TauE/SafE family protein [Jannaschia formosa]|uniref:sulfite exporter TauE/SafE family protein n=1 Tax=Jannaschia formosa TaxID=2259592 RepID=UPI000E1C19F0|nr:sulfite exporter TauE/SafE family protein [Jannaschia formosa]TFL19802.1 sulfite exporter TauE/SafE family protein [Jannaschia formosa]